MLRAVLIAMPLLAAAPARAEGDPDEGERLARQVCTMCHKLPDGTGTTAAPALAELATDRRFTAEDVAQVVGQPQHSPAKAQLPDDGALADLAAYLNALE